jgi:hypothetical protein
MTSQMDHDLILNILKFTQTLITLIQLFFLVRKGLEIDLYFITRS